MSPTCDETQCKKHFLQIITIILYQDFSAPERSEIRIEQL